MIVEIKVPSVGESVTEAVLGQWFKNDGDMVKKGDPLFVIETDKVTLEVESEVDGVLKITVAEGETAAIGAVVGTIDTEAAPAEAAAPEAPPAAVETAPAEAEVAPLPEPSPAPSAETAPSLKAASEVILSPAGSHSFTGRAAFGVRERSGRHPYFRNRPRQPGDQR